MRRFLGFSHSLIQVYLFLAEESVANVMMESLSKRPEGFLVKNLRDAGETKMKIELLYFDGCPC
jgi:hypothetical protein